ncbi:MAG: glutathione S-transferase [Cyanobium sp.]
MSLTLYGAARSRASMVRWYLEEQGIPYQWISLDLGAGEHRQEPFLAINPFGKVPALVDDSLTGPDGGPLKLFESGAILQHLAEHHGHEFVGDSGAARRSLTVQWLLFANASFGPALIQAASKPQELERLLTTLDRLLGAGASLLAGSDSAEPAWGAADCAVQSYLAYLPLFCAQVDLSPFPHVQTSIKATQQRPAYQLAMGQG